MVRTRLLLSFVALVGLGGLAGPTAAAAEPLPVTAGGGSPSPSPSLSASPSPSPSASPSASPPPPQLAGDASATGNVPMVDASTQVASPVRFGVGARLRLTSVPKWMLGLFLDESVPLTSYTAGLEFFRRSGNNELVLGLAYQSLSPNPGNWLGKGNDGSTETDYVQFDGLASWSFDVAFVRHADFNEYIGLHYGGGIGIGIVSGRMLRTSNGTPGCAATPGDPTRCFPVIDNCTQGPCTEAQLRGTEGGTDGYRTPSRYADSHIPSVYPIVNLLTGVDVRLPNVPGLAMRFDVGFFLPYFFVGPSIAYQI